MKGKFKKKNLFYWHILKRNSVHLMGVRTVWLITVHSCFCCMETYNHNHICLFFYVSNINIFHSLQFLLINVIKYISFPTAQTDQKIL